MEAVNRWVLSRSELDRFATEKGFADQLVIPEDGENIDFDMSLNHKRKNNPFRGFILKGLFGSTCLG